MLERNTPTFNLFPINHNYYIRTAQIILLKQYISTIDVCMHTWLIRPSLEAVEGGYDHHHIIYYKIVQQGVPCIQYIAIYNDHLPLCPYH